MISKIKTVFITIFFVFLFYPSLYAEYVFKIVTHEHVPPHICIEDGVSKGIDVDIITELFNRIGIRYKIQHYPWKRALETFKSGGADMLFPAFKTDERKKFALYPEHPIEFMKFALFVRKDQVFTYEKAEDLKGKKIGLVKGYSAGPTFDSAREKGYFVVEETSSTELDINKLMSGRIDCFIQQFTIGRYLINKLGFSGQIVELRNPVERKIPTYLILSKKSNFKNPDNLLSKINPVLKIMWDDGTIDSAIKKYID